MDHIEVTVLDVRGISDNAALLRFADDQTRMHWIPFSLIACGGESFDVSSENFKVGVARWKLGELSLLSRVIDSIEE